MLCFVEAFAPLPGHKSPHPESKAAVAERLYVLRKSRGYVQSFAAKAVGVKQSYWGAWESPTNPRQPTRKQLIEIEKVFGTPREWIESGIASRMPQDLLRELTETRDRLSGQIDPRKRVN